MRELIIRRAKKEEVKIIQYLNNELINYEMKSGFDNYVKDWALSEESEKYFLEMIENQYVAVAEVEGEIVGMVMLKISCWFLSRLMVWENENLSPPQPCKNKTVFDFLFSKKS